MTAHTNGPFGPVHIVGISCTDFVAEHDAMLDELVFDALSCALHECALRKQDLDLSVQASMDVYDGRSISSGLTTAAAGGYLSDSYRIEGDAGAAIIAAAQAVAAGDVEVAAAVAVFNPETASRASIDRLAYLEQLSSLAFDPIFDRPVGMSAATAWAMQAVKLMDAGATDEAALAARAAENISRGAGNRRAARTQPVDAAAVLASPLIAWPLRELMLPALTTGAAAVVLASPARAARLVGRSAVLRGVGHATADYTWSGEWLTSPAIATAHAARQAYAGAGMDRPESEIGIVEHSAPTPALEPAVLAALGLTDLPRDRVNRSGGTLSSYPGLVNGAARLLDAVEGLETTRSMRAVVHSTDTVTGPISEDVTVLVVDAA